MNWKDVTHYGVSALLLIVGAVAEAGVPLPGVTVSDPKTVMLAAAGVFVAGLKGGWKS